MSGDEGAQSIARILAHSSGIEHFKMVSSRVGPEGGAALGDALATAGVCGCVGVGVGGWVGGGGCGDGAGCCEMQTHMQQGVVPYTMCVYVCLCMHVYIPLTPTLQTHATQSTLRLHTHHHPHHPHTPSPTATHHPHPPQALH